MYGAPEEAFEELLGAQMIPSSVALLVSVVTAPALRVAPFAVFTILGSCNFMNVF
jgi:hypothetical protein